MSERISEHTMTRRDDVASAFITAWVVVGLFLDGWAHNVDKPETFFTPWHAVLYSGFVAGAFWNVSERARARRLGIDRPPMPRLMLTGLLLFGAGGMADMVWHQVFGVEESVEALLSPTHLVLMSAGLLLTTGTVRSILARGERAPTLREFAPALSGIALALAVVGFFLQFASAFRIEDHAFFDAGATEGDQVYGVLSVLLTNALFLGAMAWTLRNFRPPRGTFTAVLGGAALMLSSLHGFDEVALVAPAVVAGLAADALVVRGRSERSVLLVTPAVLWTGWFGVYHLVWGLGWVVEMWTGTIFFAVATGFGFHLLTASPAPASAAPAIEGNGAAAVPRAPRTPYRVLAELLT